MNNAEFQKHLEKLYAKHFRPANRARTFNELVHALRMDSVDYNISIPPFKEDMGWFCISSVNECFIPIRTLDKDVISVEYDAEATEENKDIFDGICLTVTLGD